MQNASSIANQVPYYRHSVTRLLDTLHVELTTRCNNSCLHCSINSDASDACSLSRELPAGHFIALFNEAAALGALTVIFTGGEPLLRDDFEELYIHARKCGMKVRLMTNATLLDESHIRLFKKIPPLEPLYVTLYGMSAQSYEAVSRLPGSFAMAMHGIELLKAYAIPFVIRGIWLNSCRHDNEAFQQLASTIPSMREPFTYTLVLDHRSYRDSTEKNRVIDRLRATPEEYIEYLKEYLPSYRDEMKQLFGISNLKPHDKLFACGAGSGGGCVDAYGTFQPCLQLRAPETGYQLAEGSMHDALSRSFSALRKKRAVNPDYLERCARCFIRPLCEQCPAKSWMEHGTLDTPVEYLCSLAHASARFLGLLSEGEKSWEVSDMEARIGEFIKGYPEKVS